MFNVVGADIVAFPEMDAISERFAQSYRVNDHETSLNPCAGET